MKSLVTIIDYGVGNTYSVSNALHELKYDFKISRSPKDILNARALILPGVGAYGEAMAHLRDPELNALLQEAVVLQKKPILGICLGMQLLAEYSLEGGHHTGLGWIEGHVELISADKVRVPHVGWNTIQYKSDRPLFSRLKGPTEFYFDHSYHFRCKPEYAVATCQYGSELVAAVQKENIFGVQFHPEKSQLAGLRLIYGFLLSAIKS